jgi:hypothetical protein
MNLCIGRGFNSHPVHLFLLYNYGIILNSFLGTVGQIQQQYEKPNFLLISKPLELSTVLILLNDEKE